MIQSLEKMYNVKNKIDTEWLEYLYITKEKNYNVLNVKSLKEITNHSVFNYVLRTLEVLNKINEEEALDASTLYYVEETLKWSEVSKCGTKEVRKTWKKNKYNLFCHNIASSEIYSEKNNDEIVKVLIKTHGLIGQHIKGEVRLNKNIELYNLVKEGKISKGKLRKILIILNRCIIEGISENLYKNVSDEVDKDIDLIINGKLEEIIDVTEIFRKLNKRLKDEDATYLNNLDEKVTNRLKMVFNSLELWYYESALKEFSIKEQVKVILLISNVLDEETEHLTFEKFMKELYLEYKDKKEVNIYKKRIIESYLKEITLNDILDGKVHANMHIETEIKKTGTKIEFNFKFSKVSKKLIEFCEVAGLSDTIYQSAVYMLYDLFNFRYDAYDRFYNELNYLKTMNSSMNEKSVLLNYIVGQHVLDVGPGGGVMLDLIENYDASLKLSAIDLSQNVIDKLNNRVKSEKHNWNIVKGDALNLNKYFEKESVDTIIYSSIIHELYSYIEFNGKKFNKETIKKSLISAYNILSKHGRIIIRDGIMTEEKDEYRLIEFKDKKDIEILKRYCNDFKGRCVTYEQIDDKTVKMLVNDAMEFLYTYTWGEDSYPLEVKEQFGYFTLSEYTKFIKDILPNVKIIESVSFLQKGYSEHLLPKISIYDINKNIVDLPDSTCIIVIEKV